MKFIRNESEKGDKELIKIFNGGNFIQKMQAKKSNHQFTISLYNAYNAHIELIKRGIHTKDAFYEYSIKVPNYFTRVAFKDDKIYEYKEDKWVEVG